MLFDFLLATNKKDIAYNVLDIDQGGERISLEKLQKEVTMLEGVISSRIMFGTPGAGYAVSRGGDYFV